MLNNENRFNLATDLAQIAMDSLFDQPYEKADAQYSILGNTLSVGETEYILPNGVKKW